MGIGLTASSASNFKMNRLPGEFFIFFHFTSCLISDCDNERLSDLECFLK